LSDPIHRLGELLKVYGYELVGVFDRDKLRLDQVEKCYATEGTGSCSCSIDFEIVLHEADVSDIAIYIEASGFGFAEGENYRCEGEIAMELYAETNTTKITIDRVAVSACAVWV
jgi:hypothetical protein